jgi:hypothetical protein
MSASPRSAVVPNANSPQVLARLVDMVARGVRSSRGLQEALGVELRTVQYYSQAAEWLGLLESEPEVHLTPLGLEYAYAGKRRGRVYARAVWSTPFVAELMAGRNNDLPPLDVVAQAISHAEPDMAPATVRRRASAVRSLIGPALGGARPRSREQSAQLALPLGLTEPNRHLPSLDLTHGREHNPDLYRFVLGALLDHGELSLGELRSLLDRASVRDAPIGSYVDMALQRGDARRLGEQLVATPGAVARREVAHSTASIMLSHPAYRAWLDDMMQAATGDRHAEIRRSGTASRFARWDVRLLRRPASPETLQADLRARLMDRSLDSFPLAGDPGPVLQPVKAPFLDAWEDGGLAICLPPSLVQLRGGLPVVNRQLKQARLGAIDVGPPSLAHRPSLFHGGMLHPGEPLPRSIPDAVSLRLRLLMHAPYPAMVAAIALLHRGDPQGPSIMRRNEGWAVDIGPRSVGSLLPVLDAFAASRGWVACRRLDGGLTATDLLLALDATGVLTVLDRRALLAERFFSRMRTDAEQMEVHNQLRPLAEALGAWLASAEPLDNDG